MTSELVSLARIISSGIESIQKNHEGLAIPSLDDAVFPAAVFDDPQFMQSASLILAAASRLMAALKNPFSAVQDAASGMYTSALLNLVVEVNVTEALKEAGPDGLHIRELSQKVGVDTMKLGRCMRYLCCHHIYREVSPDVFANNRLSLALDTGKPFNEVCDRRPDRYSATQGVAAIIGHTTDEGLKGASALSNLILESKGPDALGPYEAPAQQAFGFKGGFFEFLESPGNEKRLNRFGVGMTNLQRMIPPNLILTGFGWETLPQDSLVVDVGGGVGSVTLPLARAHPKLRYIVQDRPPVVADGEKFWKKEFPEALESGLVQLKGHDFFGPQPIQDAAVFMLRFILHDWPDSYAKKILTHLRAAATPLTKLLILEHIVPYLCPQTNSFDIRKIPGMEDAKLPSALRGNMGPANPLVYAFDIQMMNFCGSQERTIGHWDDLMKSTGWEIERVQKGPLICSLTCVPV